MITKHKNLITNIQSELKDGSGKTTILNITDAEGLNNKGRLFSIMSLEPGSSIGKHKHINEREIYYILEGTGLIYDNGENTVVNAGDTHLIQSGETHSILNDGESTLKFIALIIMD